MSVFSAESKRCLNKVDLEYQLDIDEQKAAIVIRGKRADIVAGKDCTKNCLLRVIFNT